MTDVHEKARDEMNSGGQIRWCTGLLLLQFF